MNQRIELRALVAREGKLLLFRDRGGRWELPGGSFADEADDVDAAMDTLLRTIGIISPNISDDFLETTYLPDGNGRVVLNLYAPMNWFGEPFLPFGGEQGWFHLDEVEELQMDDRIRAAILRVLGGADGDDDRGQVIDFTATVAQAIREEVVTAETTRPDPPEPLPFPATQVLAGPPAPIPVTVVDADAPVTEVAIGPAAPDDGNARAAGLDVLGTISGRDPEVAVAGLRTQSPELADDIIDFALAKVWADPTIDRRTRSLQVVAMLAALGGRPVQLRSHLIGALNHGATPEQLVQTLRMVAVYAGFPASLTAWPIMEDVFVERGIPRPNREGQQ